MGASGSMPRLRLAVGVAAALLLGLALLRLAGQTDGLFVAEVRIGATPATVFTRAGADAPAPAVVIAHGFSGSRQLMAPFATTLARAGYVAVAYDAARPWPEPGAAHRRRHPRGRRHRSAPRRDGGGRRLRPRPMPRATGASQSSAILWPPTSSSVTPSPIPRPRPWSPSRSSRPRSRPTRPRTSSSSPARSRRASPTRRCASRACRQGGVAEPFTTYGDLRRRRPARPGARC
jgi:hypothetical protein